VITKNKLLFTILSFSLALSAFAEVYRIVDEEGKITYTDTPPHDALTKEKVHLPTANIQPALKTAPAVKAVEDEIDGYQEIALLAPTQDTTIPPGQEAVTVQVGLKPPLKVGHLIQLLLNGQPYGPPTATTSFSIGSLIRGESSVQVQVVDTEGSVIGLSNTATIHVKRGSAQHPNNIKPPPPKPTPY
jgi:hypothetical protein